MTRIIPDMVPQLAVAPVGYVSMNPLTILSRELRRLPVTAEQKKVRAAYDFTQAEIDNVTASIEG